MHKLRGRATGGTPQQQQQQRLTPTLCRRRIALPRASASSSSPPPPPPPDRPPNKNHRSADHTRRAFADPQTPPLSRIGSEHGQAFEAMSGLFGSGGARRLDVDALNEQLKPTGALRLRQHLTAPDEAHGAIFAFDSVVADLAPVKEAAWRLLAKREGLPITEAALRAAAVRASQLPPDAIAVRVFGWARSFDEGRRLALEHAALGAELLASEGPDLLMEALDSMEQDAATTTTTTPHPLARAREGAVGWLDALARHGVPLAAVSSLDRRTLRRCLDRVGLHDHFDALVTADDEPESLAERLLMASLKLSRAPNACVSFDATPEGVTAAHNASMRCVAVVGRGGGGGNGYYGRDGGGGGGGGQRHALRGADLTVFSLSELSVINVRRLFADAQTPGTLTLAREGAERDRGGRGGGDGGGNGVEGAGRWRRWSTRRAVLAAD